MFSFDKTILNLLAGRKISRTGWNDKRHYVFLKEGMLQLHKAGEKESLTHPWILSEEDLTAGDWHVL